MVAGHNVPPAFLEARRITGAFRPHAGGRGRFRRLGWHGHFIGGAGHPRNGEVMECSMRAGQAHPALMLTARITLPHFSVSSAMNLPKSPGDSANTVPPKSASRALNLGSARPGYR
jgi:hypothetical protein